MQPEPRPSASETTATIQDDPVSEARRLLALVQDRGIILRALGGIAIALRCPHAALPTLKRSYGDIDFMGIRKQGKSIRELFESAGYQTDKHFNALHGDQRLMFLDEAHGRHIDVFLNTFKMCHTLPLETRLSLHPQTISPADLLLTKLQIIQLNTKDIQDLLALLLDFAPVTAPTDPGEELDLSLITRICATDWGWFTTVQDNFDRLKEEAFNQLPASEAAQVQERITLFSNTLLHVPKSLSWRIRAQVGRRLPWYELPEEVHR